MLITLAKHFSKSLVFRRNNPKSVCRTPIEGWMPWNIQRDDPRARAHKKELDDSANRLISRGQTKEKAINAFEQELADYNAGLIREKP